MKRKLFTLLMAFVAVAAFQVNAQSLTTGSVWINADTTGINSSYDKAGVKAGDPYPNNKVNQLNWLNYDGGWKIDSGTKTGVSSNRMQIDVIGTVYTQFSIFAKTQQLSLPYVKGGVTYNNFEIVQYSGTSATVISNRNRRPQQIDATGAIEGYLTPAHQAKPNSTTVESSYLDQLFVVSDQAGKLSIMRLGDFADFIPASAATYAVKDTLPQDVNFTLPTALTTTGYFGLSQAWMDYQTAQRTAASTTNDWFYGNSGSAALPMLTPSLNPGLDLNGKFYVKVLNMPSITLGSETANCAFYYFDKTKNDFQPVWWGAVGTQMTLEIPWADPLTGGNNFDLTGTNNTLYSVGLDKAQVIPHMEWLPANLDKSGNPIYTPVYIKTEKVGGRWLRFEDLQDGLFPACKDAEGSPMKYFAFTNATYGNFGGTDENGDFYSTLEIAALYDPTTLLSLQATTIQLNESRCDRIDVAQRTAKKYDYVNINANNIRNYGIDLFQFRAPEAGCKILTASENNAIKRQVGSSWTAFGGLFDLIDVDYFGNGRTADLDDARLQEFAVWINEDGTYEVFPAAAIKIDHGNTSQNGAFVANLALVENRHPGRLYYDATDCSTPIKVIEDENYFKVGWYDGTLTSGDEEGICVITNQKQDASAFQYVKFEDACRTFVNEIADQKWQFIVVNNLWSVFEDYVKGLPSSSYTDAQKAAMLAEYKTKNAKEKVRDWVLSTSVNDAGEKRLIIVPEEVVMPKVGAADTLEYWKNPHDSVNMAAHWAIVKPSALGYKTVNDEGYIIYNMLGDVIAYDPTGVSVTTYSDLVNGFLTNNAIIPTKINNLPSQSQWYDPNGTANTNARFIWNTVNFVSGSGKFFLALQNAIPNTTTATPITANDYILGRSLVYFASQSPYWGYTKQVTHDNYYIDEARLVSNGSCGGILLSLKDIPYVPTYAHSYKDEAKGDTTKINTSDPTYQDKEAPIMFKDSLTAYLYLHGGYDFKEAAKVLNELVWTYKTVSVDGTGYRKEDQAVLGTSSKTENLQIIPLETTKRTDIVKAIQGYYPAANLSVRDSIDYLYGESYKWFLVKDDKGRYLAYDTVNTQAGNNRSKYGLIFRETTGNDELDLARATPVRLYQPLVGDKYNGNFIIQFYSPLYEYYLDGANMRIWNWNGTNPSTTPSTTQWRDIESSSASDFSGGELLFAKIDAQTNYIHATKNANDATRFNYNYIAPPVITCDDCMDIYVQPDWMAQEHLLGLPIANYSFNSLHEFTEYGMSEVTDDFGKFAYLSKESQNITHKLVGYIVDGYFYPNDSIDYDNTTGEYTFNPARADLRTQEFYHGANALKVPVYTVQNPDDKYLTVASATDQKQLGNTVTIQDVTGVKLNWADKISDNNDSIFYYPATQYFAIVDLCEDYDVKPIPVDYQRFAYFPLASYVVDYKTGKIITYDHKYGNNKTVTVDSLTYNWALGTPYICSATLQADSLGADLTNAFRIGQYSVVNKQNYSMIVVGATSGSTSNVPVEFAWGKNEYDMPFCDYQLVMEQEPVAAAWTDSCGNTYAKDSILNWYYEYNDRVLSADANSLAAHWAIVPIDKTNDEYLAKFVPEVTEEYGKAITQGELDGRFYFKIVSEESDGSGYKVFAYDLANYNKASFYAVKSRHFTFTCVGHTLPYYDLEADGNFNIDYSKLAAFEAIYLDRNIYTDPAKENNKVYTDIDTLDYGYQTLVNKIMYDDLDHATYLRVYRSYRRALTDSITIGGVKVEPEHVIPYYNFAYVVKDAKGKEVEYFLNVKTHRTANENDSVRFSPLTSAQKGRLLSFEKEANRNEFGNYMFCLPIAVNGIDRVSKDLVDDPLYMMTYDSIGGNTNSPYFLIIGAGSDLVTARKVSDAYNTCAKARGYDWSIYTINYGDIAPDLVTVWSFWGEQGEDNEWVLLREPVTLGTGDGVLSNAQIPGYTQYLGPVNMAGTPVAKLEPVNYAKIVTEVGESTLKFYFVGDTLIGNYAKRPIWYYRIQDPVSEDFLTDAKDSVGVDGYEYNWQTTTNPYAYFGTFRDRDAAYDAVADKVKDGLGIDTNFRQTFGLRYVSTDLNPAEGIYQTFRVVAHADYTQRQPEGGYRYLANVQGRYVFVEDPNDAMIFSWGKDVDDKWVSIKPIDVNAFVVIGAQGAIQVKNAEGVVDLYTIDGRKVSSTPVTSSTQTIIAPAGVVIVKNGANVAKVLVK